MVLKQSIPKLWILIVFVSGFAYGLLCERFQLFPYKEIKFVYGKGRKYLIRSTAKRVPPVPPGRWRPVVEDKNSNQISDESREQVEAVGYLTGHDLARDTRGGVMLHDHKLAYQGLNLSTSGHAPEATLMDMDGKILHQWKYDCRRVWPDIKVPSDTRGDQYWIRAHLFENGDLLAIYEGIGLIKLNKNSELIWSHSRAIHHDLFVQKDGTIYTLSKELKTNPEIQKKTPIWENFITILTPEGKLIKNISILKALANSPYAPLLGANLPLPQDLIPGDLFHTNTVEVLDGSFQDRSPFFKAGNLLICIRNMSLIAIVDPEKEQVVWAISGMWKRPHRPTFLANGNLLLFDNLGNMGKSKVIEFDPLTLQLIWKYDGSQPKELFTQTMGSSQRLLNGNTLITESDRGRAIEVTNDGRIVWEYMNPNRAGERHELIATLCEMVRLDPTFPLDWIKK